MNRLIHRLGRVLFFVAVSFAANLVLNLATPTAASAAGDIKGGVYCVEITVEGNKTCAVIEAPPVTTITLTPDSPGKTVSVSKGKIHIGNVAAGTYTVKVDFLLSRETCSNVVSFLSGASIGLILAPDFIGDLIDGFLRSRICPQDGQVKASRTFANVKVVDGQTTFLEGSDDTTGRVLATGLRIDPETGLPIIECSGGSASLNNLFVDWIICPLIEFSFRAIDIAVTYILVPFLSINPISVNNPDGTQTELYKLWDNIRNLTNIIFILIFFVVIFWQAIGSIYGVKKVLPRLIVMAIATNLSFFFCQFFIDVSNIMGVGVASLLTSSVIGQQPVLDLSSSVSPLFNVAPSILTALFVFVLFALLMIVIGAVVLILRQVLLIFLVIASPLAFAAGVLPNTSSMLNRWINLFVRLILMYPVTMFIIAAGRIAGHIITSLGAQF